MTIKIIQLHLLLQKVMVASNANSDDNENNNNTSSCAKSSSGNFPPSVTSTRTSALTATAK